MQEYSPFLWAIFLSSLGSISTGLGGILTVMQQQPDQQKLGLLQGISAGIMLHLSFVDLLHESIKVVGFVTAHFAFFAGAAFMALVVKFIPEPEWFQLNSELFQSDVQIEKGNALPQKNRKFLITGIITALGISCHNFPEGIAVYLGALKGIRFGLPLAIAICLHNLPEGMAVAMPLYYATNSKWKAAKVAILSGLFEPLGVLIVATIFGTSISESVLHSLFGAVGGVMTFLVIYEIFPLAMQFCGNEKATLGVFLGLSVSFCTLSALQYYETEY